MYKGNSGGCSDADDNRRDDEDIICMCQELYANPITLNSSTKEVDSGYG